MIPKIIFKIHGENITNKTISEIQQALDKCSELDSVKVVKKEGYLNIYLSEALSEAEAEVDILNKLCFKANSVLCKEVDNFTISRCTEQPQPQQLSVEQKRKLINKKKNSTEASRKRRKLYNQTHKEQRNAAQRERRERQKLKKLSEKLNG